MAIAATVVRLNYHVSECSSPFVADRFCSVLFVSIALTMLCLHFGCSGCNLLLDTARQFYTLYCFTASISFYNLPFSTAPLPHTLNCNALLISNTNCICSIIRDSINFLVTFITRISFSVHKFASPPPHLTFLMPFYAKKSNTFQNLQLNPVYFVIISI